MNKCAYCAKQNWSNVEVDPVNILLSLWEVNLDGSNSIDASDLSITTYTSFRNGQLFICITNYKIIVCDTKVGYKYLSGNSPDNNQNVNLRSQ